MKTLLTTLILMLTMSACLAQQTRPTTQPTITITANTSAPVDPNKTVYELLKTGRRVDAIKRIKKTPFVTLHKLTWAPSSYHFNFKTTNAEITMKTLIREFNSNPIMIIRTPDQPDMVVFGYGWVEETMKYKNTFTFHIIVIPPVVEENQ
jgi:hypothetical protein